MLDINDCLVWSLFVWLDFFVCFRRHSITTNLSVYNAPPPTSKIFIVSFPWHILSQLVAVMQLCNWKVYIGSWRNMTIKSKNLNLAKKEKKKELSAINKKKKKFCSRFSFKNLDINFCKTFCLCFRAWKLSDKKEKNCRIKKKNFFCLNT